MALEATHIRFALEVKDLYGVQGLKKYVVGTIYPDSRYVSEIGRELTHPPDYKDWNPAFLDDFKKGWLVHLLCDNIQYKVTQEKFPQIFEGFDASHGNERWIKHTALKILQDMDDAKKFDVQGCLHYLDFAANPNGEDIERVRKYNRLMQDIYKDPNTVTLDTAYGLWIELGIGEDLAAKVKFEAEAYLRDNHAMKLVGEIYPEIVFRLRKMYSSQK